MTETGASTLAQFEQFASAIQALGTALAFARGRHLDLPTLRPH